MAHLRDRRAFGNIGTRKFRGARFGDPLSPRGPQYTLEGRVLDYSTDVGPFTIIDQSGESNTATLYSGRGISTDGVADIGINADISSLGAGTYQLKGKVRAPTTGFQKYNSGLDYGGISITAANVWQDFETFLVSGSPVDNVSVGADGKGGFSTADWSDVGVFKDGVRVAHWLCADWADLDAAGLNGKTIVDSGPNQLHGTCTGCSGFTGEATIPQTADKNWNAGYYHTGGSAMVIPDFTTFAGQIANATISFWFTLSDVTTTQMLFSLDGGALRTYVTSGNLKVGTSTTVASLSAGTNYFAELNINGSGKVDTVTLNGVVEHSGAIAHSDTFGDLGIGCRTTADVITLPILGTINNFQVENRASVPLVKGGMAYDSIDFTATYQGKFTCPDGQRSEAGKGITCTGLCIDTNTDTFWVGNHGEELDPVTTPRNSSLVNMTKTGVKLSEIDLVPIIGTSESVQGVAFDPTDNTLFFAATDDNVYHINKAGSLLHTFPYTNVNGLCYDPTDDILWVTDNSGIDEMNKATGAVGTTFARVHLSAHGLDQLAHNPANDTICATYGNNGTTGAVATVWKRGGGLQVTTLDTTETRSVEGIAFDGATVWIANDGYFHNTGTTNTIQEFLWAESTSSIALETSGLPAATQLITASDANDQIDALGTAISEPRLNTQQLNLFGEGEYSSTPDSASLDVTTAATWELWGNFYGTVSGGDQSYFSKYDSGGNQRSWYFYKADDSLADELNIRITSSGTIPAEKTVSGITDSVSQIVLTLTDAVYSLYIDGVFSSTLTGISSPVFSSSAPVQIGCINVSGLPYQFASTKIGSAKIYNVALTADEVLTNYNTQKSLYGL